MMDEMEVFDMMQSDIEELRELLRAAVERVKIANAEGNPILSAWLPDAEKALGQ